MWHINQFSIKTTSVLFYVFLVGQWREHGLRPCLGSHLGATLTVKCAVVCEKVATVLYASTSVHPARAHDEVTWTEEKPGGKQTRRSNLPQIPIHTESSVAFRDRNAIVIYYYYYMLCFHPLKVNLLLVLSLSLSLRQTIKEIHGPYSTDRQHRVLNRNIIALSRQPDLKVYDFAPVTSI